MYQLHEGKLVEIYNCSSAADALRKVAELNNDKAKYYISSDFATIKIDTDIKIPAGELQDVFAKMQARINELEADLAAGKPSGGSGSSSPKKKKSFTDTSFDDLATEQSRQDFLAVEKAYDKARAGLKMRFIDGKQRNQQTAIFDQSEIDIITKFINGKLDFSKGRGKTPVALFPFLVADPDPELFK